MIPLNFITALSLCLPLSGLLISNPGFSQNVEHITFTVDVNSVVSIAQDSILNVQVRGSVAPLSWVKGIKMTDADNDGIYSATVDFPLTQPIDLYYKYTLDEIDFEAGDARQIEIETGSPLDTFRYEKRPANPFKKFIGRWTLKDNLWEQGNTNQGLESIKIPDHYSICEELNTQNSLLWKVEAPSARGHILWVYNTETQEVHHSSSFFPSRSGIGTGKVNENGDVTLKISFEGEAKNTYRRYEYRWVSEDEYTLRSIQYDNQDKPTGDYYGGAFVRITQ
ncbi:hypothetical protein [Tunicatimonas pelagia]|uniref:hypothetical protein n=1 Tax=Tunicatimonas pelagia TaxID=931531 RepID=UPI00266658BB|nr:hypothetical protein [Tunicatimonas pelagia]WKN46037.1 hypothetical protein P0M28_13865 [Tunicatimonas pelagia]